jgi:hypothetical protein
MTKFHTVKEAAQITGKSPSSIRRIIHPIIQKDQHPDRDHIHPTVEEARKLRLQGTNFAWQISDDLLRREIPTQPEKEKGSDTPAGLSHGPGTTDLIATLQGELAIKNQQIEQQAKMLSQQMELISGLSERLREGNVLIGGLQRQLALPDAGTPGKSTTIDARVQPSGAGKPPTKSGTKTPNKPGKAKRGILSWMFRRP